MANCTKASGSTGAVVRLDWLTACRGILALLVMVHNHWVPLLVGVKSSIASFLGKGHIAVDFFFLLSGFVIAHVYGDRFDQVKRKSYQEFLAARAARIYPLYFCVMLSFLLGEFVFLAIQRAGHQFSNRPFSDHHGLIGWVSATAMLQSWGVPSGLDWNPPAWSVSSEWLLYLLAPALVMVLMHRISLLASLVAAVGLLSLLAEVEKLYFRGSYDLGGLPGTFRCLIEFPLGVIACRLGQWINGKRFPKAPLVFAWAACGMGALFIAGADVPLEWAIVSWWFFLSLTFAASTVCPAPPRWLIALGESSYALYLIHWWFVLAWLTAYKRIFQSFSPTSMLCLFTLHVAVLLIASWMAYRWVEMPGRMFLRRLFFISS